MDSKHHFMSRLLGCRAAGAIPVIAEIKASTPSHGDLLRHRHVEDIAQQYESASMACISVVTGKWFGGSTELLARVASVTSLPVLHKDFIVSRSGIERSKELGAGAVLLTKKLVDVDTLKKLTDYALSLEMTPFIEVSSACEMQGLRITHEAILAVCNRNISVKETDDGDISTSLSLLEAARATGAGAVVSASAITNPDEAKQLITAGFDGLLIGTAFLRTPDLRDTLSAFCASLVLP